MRSKITFLLILIVGVACHTVPVREVKVGKDTYIEQEVQVLGKKLLTKYQKKESRLTENVNKVESYIRYANWISLAIALGSVAAAIAIAHPNVQKIATQLAIASGSTWMVTTVLLFVVSWIMWIMIIILILCLIGSIIYFRDRGIDKWIKSKTTKSV
jgi:type II secretory pathway component PulF